MTQLEDRIAVVTGASRGIGRAIAEDLARRGATVIVNFNSSPAAAEEVVAAIGAAGGKAQAMQADVSQYAQAEALIKGAVDQFGRIDILVNNAGITRDTLIMMLSEQDWDSVIETNLKSTFNCSKAAVKAMMRKRYGRIVNMSSVAAISGNPGQTNYSASKAGIIGFTKALAREVGSRAITVNAVAPGFIETDLTAALPEEIRAGSLTAIPLGRWGKPEDVAAAVSFLVSEEAAYITGQVLSVDGGMVMG